MAPLYFPSRGRVVRTDQKAERAFTFTHENTIYPTVFMFGNRHPVGTTKPPPYRRRTSLCCTAIDFSLDLSMI